MLDYLNRPFPTQNYDVVVDFRACSYIRDNLEKLEVGSLYDEKRPTGKKLVDCKSEPLLVLNFFDGFKRLKGTKFGKRIDSYAQNKANPRRMITTGTSLQGISRIIRHTICRDNMIDFDMYNCHPVMLENWCRSKNIACEHIEAFNNNRPERFNDVSELMGWSKTETKTYLLRLTNGGGLQGMYNQDILKKLDALEWFPSFESQLYNIRKLVIAIYPDLMKKAIKEKGKQYYNLDGVVISYLLTNLENQILQILVNGCIKRKVKISALIYDGFMAYKDSVLRNDLNKEELCRFLEEEVKQISGYHVKIIEKEMTEGIDIPEYYVIPEDRLKQELEESKLNKAREEEEVKHMLKKSREKAREEKKRKSEEEKINKQEYKREQRELKKQAKEQEEETDEELAELFLEQFKGSIVYDKRVGVGYFYLEKTRLWIQFNTFEALGDSMISFLGIQEAKKIRNVIYIVKLKLMNNEDDVSRFNMTEGIIALDDFHVYDMKKGEKRLRLKEDYCSFFLKRTFDENYNKEWVNTYIGELLCPNDKIDQTLISQFLELLGYVFTGENNLKYILMFIGGGDNGKSLLLECVMKLLEQYAVGGNQKIFKKSKFDSDTHEAHLYALMNRRATFISEMDDKDEFNCKLLKAISGNDEISIRNSGSPTTHSVTLKTVLLIATNVVSRYEDATFENRLCCIKFPNKFARDDGKAQLIKSHLNDLFCAILEGATRYYNRGKKIELVKSIKDYTTEIKEEKNPFLQFIKNNSYEKKENAKLLCGDMYIAYVDDLRKNKYEPKGKEKFYLEVEKHFGITKKKINTGNIYELASVEEEVKTED